MLVLKIQTGEYLTIFDRLDGASPPITIRPAKGEGEIRVAIAADPRYGIVRSNAKSTERRVQGGMDAKPIPA